MPRRAAPGDRDRIEAALPDDLHHALAQLCGLFGIPFGFSAERMAGWQQTPLQAVFETAAVVERARALVAGGLSEEVAMMQAAGELGVPYTTIRNRLENWVRWSRQNRSQEIPITGVTRLRVAGDHGA